MATPRYPRWLLTGFWLCIIIAIAVVIRRMVALYHPTQAGPPQLAALDATFASHAFLTQLHIIPAALFVLLAAIVLLRSHTPAWLQRLFFLLGAITGLTAYAMTRYAIGGWTERSAVLVFNTWFLFSLAQAFRYHLAARAPEQQEWSTRAVAILLGIATTRPVMGFFFATSRVTHLTPDQFFGIAFWIGFSLNALIIEFWLHSRHRRAPAGIHALAS